MGGGTLNVVNPQMRDMLSTWFPNRLEATYAWGRAINILQMLPGVRAVWPLAAPTNNGATPDVSGINKTLSYNGNPLYKSSGVTPYIDFDGTGDYLNRADEADLDILGTETYINDKGLTMGGWFRIETKAANDMGLMGKWNALGVNQRSYVLTWVQATDVWRFAVSTDLTAVVSINHTATPTVDAWTHVVGRFEPSGDMSIFVNGVEVRAATAPASIANSTADFEIGRFQDASAARYFDGHASLCFLVASLLSDAQVQSVFYHQRALFGSP